jgi:hypothetical protein
MKRQTARQTEVRLIESRFVFRIDQMFRGAGPCPQVPKSNELFESHS